MIRNAISIDPSTDVVNVQSSGPAAYAFDQQLWNNHGSSNLVAQYHFWWIFASYHFCRRIRRLPALILLALISFDTATLLLLWDILSIPRWRWSVLVIRSFFVEGNEWMSYDVSNQHALIGDQSDRDTTKGNRRCQMAKWQISVAHAKRKMSWVASIWVVSMTCPHVALVQLKYHPLTTARNVWSLEWYSPFTQSAGDVACNVLCQSQRSVPLWAISCIRFVCLWLQWFLSGRRFVWLFTTF